MRIKKRKKLSQSRTTLGNIARHFNIVKIILHGTFDDEKVKYVSDTGALLKRIWYILNAAVAARGEIGREGCEISSLVEHLGLSPWLFL